MNPRSALRWKIVLGVFMMFGAYCAASGRVGLWPGGYYAAFSLVTLGIGYSISVRVAPDLILNRVSWAADVKQWDKPIVFCFMFGPVVTCLVAGFEARENGPGVAGLKAVLGYALALAGVALTQSATAVNRFYAPVVRIQKDRGHTVVESGPYRLVRHPGNLGNLILNAAAPLMLASVWAWIPAGVLIVLTIVRTALEDRMLRLELPGYAAFAASTRSRLIPGVW